jgi:hypothetical protein
MTVTLRSQSNARATTKGSTLTHTELDNNFIHFLDTGIDIVGDDSTGATIKPGDDIKFAGSGTVSTAVSGQTLTITGSGITASSTNTLTNKTFDANGTGNSLSNVEVADLASGVLDTDISSVSGSDDTLASAKAIKTYADTKTALTGSTNNTVTTVTGSNAIQGEANLTFDGTTLGIANTSTSDSMLITTTEDSSTAGPVITMKRNSGSPADGDYLGQLKFKGENDADQEVTYAKMTGKISDASDTTEDGLLEFALMKAGSNNIGMRLTSTQLKLLNGTGLELAGDLEVGGNKIVSSSNGNIEIDTDGTGDVILKAGGITMTADGANNGAFSVVSTGTGGMVFENRAGRQEYPTSVFTLRNQPSGNAEISLGQYMQGAASDSSSDTNDNIQYFAIYFDPNNNVFSRRAGSFAGDQNIYFGYNFTQNENYLLGDGGNSFHIRQFGDGSNSYAAGEIVLEGGYVEINNQYQSGGSNTSYLEIKERSGDPTAEANAAQMYAKSGEMFVQDASGNQTQISPHNDAGEWEYYSKNAKTGKTVKVNMEKMIKKLEEITGETFFETFVPGNSH